MRAGQLAVRERLDAVEERLDDERLREDEDSRDPHERRRAGDPPAPAEPTREPERPGDGDRHEHRFDGERGQPVDQPASPALLA